MPIIKDGVDITDSITGVQYRYKPSDEFTDVKTIRNGLNSVVWGDPLPEEPETKTNIYGVEWWSNSKSSKMIRTDDAVNFIDPVPAVFNGPGMSPFDSIYPWKDMTTTTVSIGATVKLPRFYYKLTLPTEDDPYHYKLQITSKTSSLPSGFIADPAHSRPTFTGGNTIYIGRYLCNSTDYKSTSGLPKMYDTRANFRTKIKALDSTYALQFDIYTWISTYFLYLVEYADLNIVKTLGKPAFNYSNKTTGIYYTNFPTTTWKTKTGWTDDMEYHTGTTGKTRSHPGCVQYRNIEDFISTTSVWLDGIVPWVSSSSPYKHTPRVYSDPKYYSESTSASGGVTFQYETDITGTSNSKFPGNGLIVPDMTKLTTVSNDVRYLSSWNLSTTGYNGGIIKNFSTGYGPLGVLTTYSSGATTLDWCIYFSKYVAADTYCGRPMYWSR